MLLVSLCTSLLLMLSRSVFCVFSRVCASSVSMLAVVVVVKRLVIVLERLDVLFQRLVALASTKGVTVEMRGRRGTHGQKIYQGASLYTSRRPSVHPEHGRRGFGQMVLCRSDRTLQASSHAVVSALLEYSTPVGRLPPRAADDERAEGASRASPPKG